MDLDNIKIVFIDIDGTLVNSKNEVTSRTKESIKKLVDKGIKVVITSGRDVAYTSRMSKEANASSMVISTNGGDIFDYSDNTILFEDIINYKKIVSVWNYCMYNKIGLILKSNPYVYCNKYSLLKNGFNYKNVNDITECKNINITQFLIMSDNHQKMDNISKYLIRNGLFITSLSSSYYENIISDYYSLDANNSDVSKGTGVSFLLKRLNIKKEESLCFGDFYNDIEMFNECGIKVAMDNSIDEVKEMADCVTKSNDEDGIAYFIERFF